MKERIIKYLRNAAVESVTIYSYLLRGKDVKPSAFVYIPLFLIMTYVIMKDLLIWVWHIVMENPDDL